MNIATYRRPSNLDEAYDLVVKQGAYPLGGGAWSMSVGRPIASAVDLCDLGLRYIRVEGKNIAVGAMATARDLERSSLLADVFGPLFPEALGGIAGIQVRNIVTAGGSVAGRYGFSELLVVLLALDASLVFYNDGTRPLSEYLGAPRGGKNSTPFGQKGLLSGAAPRRHRLSRFVGLRLPRPGRLEDRRGRQAGSGGDLPGGGRIPRFDREPRRADGFGSGADRRRRAFLWRGPSRRRRIQAFRLLSACGQGHTEDFL